MTVSVTILLQFLFELFLSRFRVQELNSAYNHKGPCSVLIQFLRPYLESSVDQMFDVITTSCSHCGN